MLSSFIVAWALEKLQRNDGTIVNHLHTAFALTADRDKENKHHRRRSSSRSRSQERDRKRRSRDKERRGSRDHHVDSKDRTQRRRYTPLLVDFD